MLKSETENKIQNMHIDKNKNLDFQVHIKKQENQNIKYFIFQDKPYPIDFDLLIKNSNYFFKNRKQYENVDSIYLLNELDEKLISISNDGVNSLISCLQNQPCKIYFADILSLHYLSLKFEFPQLIEVTNQLIKDHSKELLLQSLLFKSSVQLPNDENNILYISFFDTKQEEENLVENIFEYIKDDQMLLLRIPVLDRIFKKFCTENQLNVENEAEIVEFLFKCLDKYGKDASILFSHVDFEFCTIGVVDRLLQNYSENFDFNMINSTLLKTTKQLTSEVSKLKSECSKLFSQMKKQIEIQEEEFERMKKEAEQRFKENEMKFKKEAKKMKENEELRVNSLVSKFEEEIKKIKENEELKLNSLDINFEEELKRIKKDEEDQIRKIEAKYEEEIKKLNKGESLLINNPEPQLNKKDEDNHIKILIEYSKGHFQLIVEPTDLIENIKENIEKQIKFPMQKQCLSYNNVELDNNKTIEDYKIHNNSTINCLLLEFMQIFIRTEINKLITIEVEPTNLIIDIKEKIKNKINIPVISQFLIYGGKPLFDEFTVNYYCIPKNATIHLHQIISLTKNL